MSIAMPKRFEDGLGYLVHHLMYAFRQALSGQCAGSGYAITSDECAVLLIISQAQGEEGLTQKEIATALARDKAVITRLLNSLSRKELVLRYADEQDRRVVRAGLTGQGADAVEHLRPSLEKLLVQVYRDIDQQEFEIARDVLCRMLKNVKAARTNCE
jgi:DNA-binding MarR family transcriptional regulator